VGVRAASCSHSSGNEWEVVCWPGSGVLPGQICLHLFNRGHEIAKRSPRLRRPDGVDVVAGLDDFSVVYSYDEDARDVECAAVHAGHLVSEFPYNDLRVSGFVNDDVHRSARRWSTATVGRCVEVLPQL
jgi:hypothetical protein